MKNFDRVIAGAIILTVILILCANLFFNFYESSDGARPYRVEVNRAAREIEQNGFLEFSLDKYSYLKNVERIGIVMEEDGEAVEKDISIIMDKCGETIEKDIPIIVNEDGKAVENTVPIIINLCTLETDSDYLIREIGGVLYRFDYIADAGEKRKSTLIAVNLAIFGMAFLLFGILLYLRCQILRPLNNLVDIPYQLSRGMLISPLKENKSRFFGKLSWGMDLLREGMEEQKRGALRRQQEQETLLSSLSHDIKTPLAAIKLYAKALEKGLYKEKEKQKETAENIGKKVDEIEDYLAQLTTALREDFLSLSVRKGEFYFSVLLQEIKKYYAEKLSLAGTDFLIGEAADCLLAGDMDRSVEVLQNLVENAIKYGDGKWISLDVSQEENCVLIRVKNSGCTLSDAEFPYIFESFWRGSNVGEMAGSGLGLFICRQIMHRMGGEIFAEREGEVFAVTVVFEKA